METHMNLQSAEQMKKVIHNVLEKRMKLSEFQVQEDFHLRIENDPFMPLVIERQGDHVSVTHYYSQNGDLVADPDLEFLVRNDKWLPVGMQDYFGYSRALLLDHETNEIRINSTKYSSILSFTNSWARNIKAQGY
jgi:hypothetical protein